MKKSNRILTLIVTAGLTFGALYATLGKDFRKDYHQRHKHECSVDGDNEKSSQ